MAFCMPLDPQEWYASGRVLIYLLRPDSGPKILSAVLFEGIITSLIQGMTHLNGIITTTHLLDIT